MKRTGLCFLVSLLILTAGCAEKPVLQLLEAQQSLAAARDAEADLFAPDEYELSNTNLKGAIDAIDAEDEERIWARNYDLAEYLLDLSIDQSEAAIAVADNARQEASFQAQLLIPQVEEAIDLAFTQLQEARGTNVVSRAEINSLDADLGYSSQLLGDARQNYDRMEFADAAAQAQQALDLAEKVRTRSAEINLYGIEVEQGLQQTAPQEIPDDPFGNTTP